MICCAFFFSLRACALVSPDGVVDSHWQTKKRLIDFASGNNIQIFDYVRSMSAARDVVCGVSLHVSLYKIGSR